MIKSKLLFTSMFSLLFIFAFGQEKEPSPFDFGKMWTFENPPKEWFAEAYNFTPEDDWFKDVRMSSLRFAQWCSASFVSPNGLIMTNHHCSRDVVGPLQKDGENFDTQGFYATNLEDERRSEGLFVEQLVQVADITEMVNSKTAGAGNDGHALELREAAIEAIKEEYSTKRDWKGLRLQAVTYYSGGKFSLYGYQKFDDIRLVWIPELDLGLYGGDPDNFTYPRYNLDCTFWRAYDENGEPLNTSAHYMPFNTDGVSEDEVTFVVGNPARTERYRTVAQLEYDRDLRYPMDLKYRKNRHKVLMDEYHELLKDPAKELEAQEVLAGAFNLSNGIKAIGGRVAGLDNPDLFNRKVAMEKLIRKQSPGIKYWDELDTAYEELEPHAWAITHLAPSPLRGKVLGLMHQLNAYDHMLQAEEQNEEEMNLAVVEIEEAAAEIDDPKEKHLFVMLLNELVEDVHSSDNTMSKLLDGKSTQAYANELLEKTKFTNPKKLSKCLKKSDKYLKDKDGLLRAARILVPRFEEAVAKFSGSGPTRRALETKIANQVFNVYGTTLPPDATFTLRISDGVIKGYDYNGTTAPYKTTYFGLYDRHFSNDKENPWSLPERWMDPPMELLMTPINFVSTNDIIGGNSGSPMINKDKEVIGLIFDGNIESLPGNFIFDDEYNRTVSVHAGGIVAALRYIYKADNLVKELEGK